MCSTKSMILLKDSVYCPNDTDSHSDMLVALKIKDDKPIADFVKVEITPPNNDYFADLSKWIFNVDQDNTPDWFVKDFDEQRARKALKEWADSHIFDGKNNFSIQGGRYYYLKDCSTVTACGSSTVMAYDSSTVKAYNSSTVTACGSSTVMAYDSSTVKAFGSSTVKAWNSSTVTAWNSSTVTACDSSTVTAYDSSTVKACDSSTVKAFGSSTVKACGGSTVILPSWSSNRKENIKLLDNSTLKDCKTKTIYQAGDWKFVKIEEKK